MLGSTEPLRGAGTRLGARGHTLVEVLIAGILLLAILGLVVMPFLMLNTATVAGTARIDVQRAIRHPMTSMVRELQAGYAATVYAPDPALGFSNGAAVYDTIDRLHLRIHYHLDADGRLLREVFDVSAGSAPVAGSPFVAARGIRYLLILPRYENPAVAGAWLDYSLPVPDGSSTTALPPKSCVPPPQSTLVLVRMIAGNPGSSSAVDEGTSFYFRN